MAYSTLTDLQKAVPNDVLVQLTDDNNTGAVDQTKIDEAINWGDDMIENYLRGKYAIPLSPVDEIIKKISVDLALYYLYTRRFDTEVPEGVRDRYKNSLKLLEQIQKGVIQLTAAAPSGLTMGVYKTQKTSDDRDFDKDDWNKY